MDINPVIILQESIYTDPVPRPYILSGGIATPASSRNKASANRPCKMKRRGEQRQTYKAHDYQGHTP